MAANKNLGKFCFPLGVLKIPFGKRPFSRGRIVCFLGIICRVLAVLGICLRGFCIPQKGKYNPFGLLCVYQREVCSLLGVHRIYLGISCGYPWKLGIPFGRSRVFLGEIKVYLEQIKISFGATEISLGVFPVSPGGMCVCPRRRQSVRQVYDKP